MLVLIVVGFLTVLALGLAVFVLVGQRFGWGGVALLSLLCFFSFSLVTRYVPDDLKTGSGPILFLAFWMAGQLDDAESDDPTARPFWMVPTGPQSLPVEPLPKGIVARVDEATRRVIFDRIMTCAFAVEERGGRLELRFGSESWPCLDRLAAEYGLTSNEVGRISSEGREKGWRDRPSRVTDDFELIGEQSTPLIGDPEGDDTRSWLGRDFYA